VTPGAFTRRTAALLAGVVVTSIVATMALSVFGPELADPPSYRADAYSRSALGHRAFVELLRQEQRTVLLSRNRTAEKARGEAITAVLEPALGKEDARARAHLRDIREAAPRLLVVLPKRDGLPDTFRRGWLESVQYAPLEEAQRILEALGVEATVFRPAASIGAWTTGSLPAPEVDDPQVLRTAALTPLVGSAQGMLVGERVEGGVHLVVVADPDLLQTHGLSRGRNAELMLALVERLDRPGAGRTLVVDETLHGHEIEPSLVKELLRFPLVLATLQAAAALALLGWAAAVRFGRPVPAPPLLRAGKDFLIENVAELLRAGGHAGEAARAYLRAAREEVLARVPPPGGAEPPLAWLLRLEAARGRTGTLQSLERQVRAIEDGRRGSEVEAVRAARRIQRWREELTHGADGDPGQGRGPQG
jgi:hypothetical protein